MQRPTGGGGICLLRARVRVYLTESDQLQLNGGGAVTTASVERRLGRSRRQFAHRSDEKGMQLCERF